MELINKDILRARLLAAGESPRSLHRPDGNHGTSVAIEQPYPLRTFRYIGEETLLGVKNLVHQVRGVGSLQYRMSNATAVSSTWSWPSAQFESTCDKNGIRSRSQVWLPRPLNALWKVVVGIFLFIEVLWFWVCLSLPLELAMNPKVALNSKFCGANIAGLLNGANFSAVQSHGQIWWPNSEAIVLLSLLLALLHPALLTVLHAGFNRRINGFERLSWVMAIIVCAPLAISVYASSKLSFCTRKTRTVGVLAAAACGVPVLVLKYWQLSTIQHQLSISGSSEFVGMMLLDLSVWLMSPCLLLAFIVNTARFGWSKQCDRV